MTTGQTLLLPLLLFSFAAPPAAASDLCTHQNGTVSIERIEPDRVAPNTPLTLIVVGGGFGENPRVLIEGVRAGRFITYKPASVDDGRLTVRLSLGFPRMPVKRMVMVETADGRRSNALTLLITTEPPPEPENHADGAEAEDTPVDPAELSQPVIRELQPAAATAGLPFALLIVGDGFQEGAVAYVLANEHAGGAAAPSYSLIPFKTSFLAGELLEINFARGFASEPSERTVYVRNPDGGESNRLTFSVQLLGDSEK